jgi:hypothetical protein
MLFGLTNASSREVQMKHTAIPILHYFLREFLAGRNCKKMWGTQYLRGTRTGAIADRNNKRWLSCQPKACMRARLGDIFNTNEYLG